MAANRTSRLLDAAHIVQRHVDISGRSIARVIRPVCRLLTPHAQGRRRLGTVCVQGASAGTMAGAEWQGQSKTAQDDHVTGDTWVLCTCPHRQHGQNACRDAAVCKSRSTRPRLRSQACISRACSSQSWEARRCQPRKKSAGSSPPRASRTRSIRQSVRQAGLNATGRFFRAQTGFYPTVVSK